MIMSVQHEGMRGSDPKFKGIDAISINESQALIKESKRLIKESLKAIGKLESKDSNN